MTRSATTRSNEDSEARPVPIRKWERNAEGHRAPGLQLMQRIRPAPCPRKTKGCHAQMATIQRTHTKSPTKALARVMRKYPHTVGVQQSVESQSPGKSRGL